MDCQDRGILHLVPDRLETIKSVSNTRIRQSTIIAYDSHWRSWVQYASKHDEQALPASTGLVLRYLQHLLARKGRAGGRSLTAPTARAHLSAIKKKHRQTGHPFDARDSRFRTIFHSLRPTTRPRATARPVSIDDIREICRHQNKSPIALRDKAILLLAFAGALSRSELANLNMTDLKIDKEGLTLQLWQDPEQRSIKGHLVMISAGSNPQTCPVLATKAWIHTCDSEGEDGPLFRAVGQWGHIEFTRLAPKTIDRAIAQASKLLDPSPTFSSRSIIAGHREAARQLGSGITVRQTLLARRDDPTPYINSSALLGL